MSGAAAMLARLQAAAEPLLTDVRVPHPLRRGVGEMPEDLVGALEALVPLVLEIEATADMLAGHAKRLRATLAEVMDESGAATIRAGQHVASVSRGRPGVVVSDPDAVPTVLMRQPPLAPDKAAILKLLTTGAAVPGCSLGNAGPVLSIRSKP